MRNDSSVVKFDNVSLGYLGVPAVFSDVFFRLTPGSFTFLTGASGSGKTSLMKLIYLALQPTLGNISIFGNDIKDIHPDNHHIVRRRIGIVLQDFGLIDHLSVFENVALPLRIRGLDVSQYTRDIVELLEWVGLGKRVHAEPAVLSGGEQQRVCIARAVISRPDLILADEPTGNVDPEMAERLMRLFVELNKLGATVLIATHDYSLIDNFRTDILKLHEGKLWGMPYRPNSHASDNPEEQPHHTKQIIVQDIDDSPQHTDYHSQAS
jgi:cell division transport system ATP-binding protein